MEAFENRVVELGFGPQESALRLILFREDVQSNVLEQRLPSRNPLRNCFDEFPGRGESRNESQEVLHCAIATTRDEDRWRGGVRGEPHRHTLEWIIRPKG